MRWALTALLPAVLPALLASPALAVDAYPTTAETRAEFEAVCRRLTQGDNPYFGSAIIAKLERRVAAAGPDSVSGVVARVRLGYDLIRLGRHQEAVAALETSLELIGRRQMRPDGELAITALANLALAHLQLAEDENCVAQYGQGSCRLPVRPEAVHRAPEHTRTAGDHFLRLLGYRPDNIQYRWLLNLTRMLSGDFPDKVPPALRPPPELLKRRTDQPLWLDIAGRVGIDTFDHGGAAIMDDFDGDGLLDLVSSSWHPCEPLRAFRNDGRGGFEDVGAAWGLDSQMGSLNVVHADYDGDGDLDLLALRGAWLGEDGKLRNSLLRNDLSSPARRFVDVTAAAGLAYPAFPTQTAAWADYDDDGDLDLYIGNEATVQSTNPIALFGQTGTPYPSQLFRNNGDGTFTDVGRGAGVTNRAFAKGVAWGDYDDDGDPDLYVSNIGPNRLYRNQGDGTFTDVAPELGVDEPSGGSFATWFFDFDNDGDLDLFNARYETPVPLIAAHYLGLPVDEGNPVLHRNEGGRFTDVSAEAGLGQPVLAMGANYGDLDNDGWPDVYLGTGVPDFDSLMPNVMFQNLDGRFRDVTLDGGFGHLQKGHGIAFGDIDNDGEQELYAQMGGAYPFDAFANAFYDNPGSDHAWIVLRLEGSRANRFALGGRVRVTVRTANGERRSIYSLVGSGGSFGGSSLQQEIGLGPAAAIESVAVRWPGAESWQEFRSVEINAFYRAVEGRPDLERLEPTRIILGNAAIPAPAHRHSQEGSSP